MIVLVRYFGVLNNVHVSTEFLLKVLKQDLCSMKLEDAISSPAVVKRAHSTDANADNCCDHFGYNFRKV